MRSMAAKEFITHGDLEFVTEREGNGLSVVPSRNHDNFEGNKKEKN